MPAMNFRREFGAISGLSVVLVVVSALLLGVFFMLVIPGLGFAWGVALGAIVSPTDAVATSIIKQTSVSKRVVAILDGESLLNDATALVIVRTAIVATAASFSFLGAVGSFAYSVVVAVAIGLAVGWLNLVCTQAGDRPGREHRDLVRGPVRRRRARRAPGSIRSRRGRRRRPRHGDPCAARPLTAEPAVGRPELAHRRARPRGRGVLDDGGADQVDRHERRAGPRRGRPRRAGGGVCPAAGSRGACGLRRPAARHPGPPRPPHHDDAAPDAGHARADQHAGRQAGDVRGDEQAWWALGIGTRPQPIRASRHPIAGGHRVLRSRATRLARGHGRRVGRYARSGDGGRSANPSRQHPSAFRPRARCLCGRGDVAPRPGRHHRPAAPPHRPEGRPRRPSTSRRTPNVPGSWT